MRTKHHKRILSLDVGCGFRQRHEKRGVIGIDLRRGFCDIVTDAEHLPFSKEVFDRVYLWNVLEHLDSPIKVLRETLRVARNNATFEIAIPVDARYGHLFFRSMILEFPFGILYAINLCSRIRKYGKLKGFLHKNRIQPQSIIPFFSEMMLEQKRPIHSWFCGRKGKILSKILGNRNVCMQMECGVGNWIMVAKKRSPKYLPKS